MQKQYIFGSPISVASKVVPSVILNRGAVAHKGAQVDLQGDLRMTNNLKWNKISIGIHFKNN